MKAMLFAAGLGTRLKPLTNDRPKALVEIQDGVTLLNYNLQYLKSFGVKTVVVNIHHFGAKVLEELDRQNNFGLNVLISDERDALLETGGGLKKAAALLEGSEPILLFNVDVLSNIDLHQMKATFLEQNCLALLACRNRESSRYLLFDEALTMRGWQNIKTGAIKKNVGAELVLNQFAFSGIHIISPKLLQQLPEQAKFSITDVYINLALENKEAIKAYLHDEDYWFDVGKPEKLAAAKKHLASI